MTKDELIELINHTVYENEDGDITGEVMNLVLNAIVATIGVEANPDDEATGTLTKIKIGEEVFDVEGDGGTVDPYPTEGSTNPVQSGGVYEALNNLIANGGLFGGFVNPSTADADTKYYYLTDVGGLYPYFDNIYVNDDSLALFYYANNSWQGAIIAPSYQLASKALLSEDLYVALGFPLFDSSLNYAQGDVVVYEGYLYVFTTDHHGQWDIADVEYNDINKELKDLYVDLFKLIDAKQDVISDLATIRSGAAAGATAYQKPSGGIPKTDLASGVQTSLGKADTAFQKPSGGIPASDLAAAVQTSLGKADTALQSYTETDPVFSASPAAGITSGDIADWDDKAEPIEIVDASTPPMTMQPDKVYQYGTLSGDTTFPLLLFINDGKAHIHCWTFATPSTAPTITWPVAITAWAGGSAPTINASKSYEVSVMDGIATIIEA